MIADDHSIIREGLKVLFEQNSSFEIIAEAEDGLICLDLLSKVEPDILILDISMPNMDGFEVLKELNKVSKKNIKILIFTMHEEFYYFLKARNMGVEGYLLKNANFTELQNAVTFIINGNTYFDSNINFPEDIETYHYIPENCRIETLTKRELEVLKKIAIGMSNKEIALKFEISERTVKNHVFNIFKKISVSDRTQAAVFAIRSNLVNLCE